MIFCKLSDNGRGGLLWDHTIGCLIGTMMVS